MVKVEPSHIVFELITDTKGLGTIVIVLTDTAS